MKNISFKSTDCELVYSLAYRYYVYKNPIVYNCGDILGETL